MIRAVIFDFYGTLVRAPSWGPGLADVLNQYGAVLDPDAHSCWQDEAADGVEHAAHSVDRDRYVAWERARLGRLAERCGVASGEVVDALYRAIKTYTLEAYAEAPAVLADLRSRGLLLAVCSNWDWDLEHALERCGLGDAFDVVVTSAQAGARKPHPRIYDYTLARCGAVAPGEVLFVGDTWGADVVGPVSAGMRAVHIWREDDQRDTPAAPGGAAQITDLRGVLDLL